MKPRKIMKRSLFAFVGLSLVLFQVIVLSSCKPKVTDKSQYINAITEVAKQYQSHCPKQLDNNTMIESVEFVDSTLKFRMTLSDEAIANINLDNARDSIINNMTDKLKIALVKGHCNLEYKYVSPNDSSSITIIPNELGTIPANEGSNKE